MFTVKYDGFATLMPLIFFDNNAIFFMANEVFFWS